MAHFPRRVGARIIGRVSTADFFTAAARYDELMGPIFFTPPARVLAQLAASRSAVEGPDILEIAAGTGRLTAELCAALPGARVTATDVAEPMLAFAAETRALPDVTWAPSDAHDLQVDDDRFDLALAQFGVMFYADRRRALGEARRVLRPGGQYLQTSWDGLRPGDVDEAAARAIEDLSPGSAHVLRDVIHGYCDLDEISADLSAAGFDDVEARVLDIDVTTTPQAVGAALALGSALQATLRGDGVDPQHAAHLMAAEIAGTLDVPEDGEVTTVLHVILGAGRA